jgi:hypothetical protein
VGDCVDVEALRRTTKKISVNIWKRPSRVLNQNLNLEILSIDDYVQVEAAVKYRLKNRRWVLHVIKGKGKAEPMLN